MCSLIVFCFPNGVLVHVYGTRLRLRVLRSFYMKQFIVRKKEALETRLSLNGRTIRETPLATGNDLFKVSKITSTMFMNVRRFECCFADFEHGFNVVMFLKFKGSNAKESSPNIFTRRKLLNQ